MRDHLYLNRRDFVRTATLLSSLITVPSWAEPARPELMLANIYAEGVSVADYWVSEKYDGVRALWNGNSLLTRAGHELNAPEWFCSAYPPEHLDGELWIGRGRFEALVATVRDRQPDDAQWGAVKFMVFDLPQGAGTFSSRLSHLLALRNSVGHVTWQITPQWRVGNHDDLIAQLQKLVREGGEGLMLKRENAPYRAERSDDLLKLKPYRDAEARVIGYVPGQGKYTGMLGALEVQRPDGTVFRIGTGFTDSQRRSPPPIGSWITYRYQGATAKGIPRFTRFLRTRE